MQLYTLLEYLGTGETPNAHGPFQTKAEAQTYAAIHPLRSWDIVPLDRGSWDTPLYDLPTNLTARCDGPLYELAQQAGYFSTAAAIVPGVGWSCPLGLFVQSLIPNTQPES